MPILRPHAARFYERRISSVTFTSAHLYINVYIRGKGGPLARRFVRLWASVEAKFTKMEDFLPWTPMNRPAKFDAASFILGGEIRNSTNAQTNTHTNSIRYIHTLLIGMCG